LSPRSGTSPAFVSEADPADKSEIYAQLGLALTYRPDKRLVEATINLGQNMRKGAVSEAGVEPITHADVIALTTSFVLACAQLCR
jgi:hypothetical protein